MCSLCFAAAVAENRTECRNTLLESSRDPQEWNDPGRERVHASSQIRLKQGAVYQQKGKQKTKCSAMNQSRICDAEQKTIKRREYIAVRKLPDV